MAQLPDVDFISNLFQFKSLITFPLESVIQANSDGIKKTLNFIRRFCFEKDGNKLKPKILTFFYQYNSNGHEKMMRVEIPVLSLVTMPYFSIDRAEFEMGINIINRARIKTESDPETNSEYLIAMLGPHNTKGLQRVGSNGLSTEEFSQYNTNMHAKLEVVTSDLPAGILQLINLSQEGIQGKEAFDYEIDCKTARLIFNNDNNEHEIHFQILPKHKGTDAPDYVKTNILISSSTIEDIEDQFTKPIEIIKGDPIGTPSKQKALFLTDDSGKAVVKIHADIEIMPSNGFIIISTDITKDFNIYYRVEK